MYHCRSRTEATAGDRQVDSAYVAVIVTRDGRRDKRHMQTTSNEVAVAEACWPDDDLRHRVFITGRCQQQVDDVVTACGFDDVLRQVVTLQQVLQVGVELPSVDFGTVEITAHQEPLLVSYELVEHVCELLAEQLTDDAGRSVDADDDDMHSRSQSELRRLDFEF